MQRNSVDNEMIDFLWIWMRIQRPVTTLWSYILQLWQAQCDYMISITIQIKLWSLNDWFNNDHCFISMIGWWIWIVLSMCCYQHLTIACPSGVCERCCTYGLTRTQVNALQSQWVCVCVCVCVCVSHLEVLISIGLSDMLQEFTAGLTHITRCLQEVLSRLKTHTVILTYHNSKVNIKAVFVDLQSY